MPPRKDDDPSQRIAAIDRVLEDVYRDQAAPGRSGAPVPLRRIGMDPGRAAELLAIARAESVRATIETGFAFGLSGLQLTKALLSAGHPSPRHVAIDPFQDRFDDAGLVAFERAGVADLLQFHREPSQLALPRLLGEEARFDLALVDGDHRFDGAFLDLYYLVHLVRPGGVLLVDDMQQPAVRAAVDFWTRNLGVVHENRVARPPRRPSPWSRWARRGSPGTTRKDFPRSRQAGLAILRVPERFPERSLDHFVRFGPDY